MRMVPCTSLNKTADNLEGRDIAPELTGHFPFFMIFLFSNILIQGKSNTPRWTFPYISGFSSLQHRLFFFFFFSKRFCMELQKLQENSSAPMGRLRIFDRNDQVPLGRGHLRY